MTAVHRCPDCHCGSPGEAFAPRPSTSSRWAIDQAKRAADEAVKRAKEKRLAAAKEQRTAKVGEEQR